MGQTLPANQAFRPFCGTSPGKVPAFFLDLARGGVQGPCPQDAQDLALRMLRTLPAGKGQVTTRRGEGGTAIAGEQECGLFLRG